MGVGEKTLEKRLKREVKNLGGECIKFASQTFTGMPDRIVLMPGGVFQFVELKSEGKKPSKRQEHVFAALKKNGFPVTVIDNHEKLTFFIMTIAKYGVTVT